MTAILKIVSEAVMQFFQQTQAYMKGHFRLTSGMHSGEYLQCARVLQHPGLAEFLGAELGGALRGLAGSVTFVIAPAVGGLIIGHEVARQLQVRFIFTERDTSGAMTLRRGFSLQPDEHVLVIEDVWTTGGSTQETIQVVEEAGGRRRRRLSPKSRRVCQRLRLARGIGDPAHGAVLAIREDAASDAAMRQYFFDGTIRDWQVVVAKFVACFLFYLVLWVPTLVYWPVLTDFRGVPGDAAPSRAFAAVPGVQTHAAGGQR